MKLWEAIKELLPVILLGAFGGFTRTVAGKKRDEPYSIRIAIQEIVIAIFCGLLIHWSMADFDISQNIKTAAVALAGYSSRCVLDILHSVFLNKLKKIVKDKEK